MSRDDIVENLGTIARSGSQAFLDGLDENLEDDSASDAIIG